MKVIGLTGGVGSGKSMVTDILHQMGYPVVQTDAIGKELMQPGQPGFEGIVELLGDAILTSDGQIDRKKLAGIIFHNSRKKAAVESIIHPLVKKRVFDDVTNARIAGKASYFFVESALLYEDHYEKICDEFWYVYAPEEVRRQRLKSSRGYSDEKIDSILKSQLSDEQFRSICRQVIDNSGSMEHTKCQLEKLLNL
ncbi:MAG: dephospho-CoA kinase [Lachnospiraceae bacterium]